MSKITLELLINKSLLISPEMKVRLLNSLDNIGENGQKEIRKAIQESDQELKSLMSEALEKDAARIQAIVQSLDQVWKRYLKDIEKVSETVEDQEQQNLLDSL
ncbi:hypothetical protein KBC97_01475 [Candidatus Gracilibacteria bacterium]|nr:hypothetical protein [Candidatus Gracilibacteria bacterium]